MLDVLALNPEMGNLLYIRFFVILNNMCVSDLSTPHNLVGQSRLHMSVMIFVFIIQNY